MQFFDKLEIYQWQKIPAGNLQNVYYKLTGEPYLRASKRRYHKDLEATLWFLVFFNVKNTLFVVVARIMVVLQVSLS